MISTITFKNANWRVDFSKPLDISIPLRAGEENVNAFYLPPVSIEPFRAGNFIGSKALGGPCNVNNITFNPHGNGTHTESVGHITKEEYPLNDCLQQFFFIAKLISISPLKMQEDYVITAEQVKLNIGDERPQAIIIRTLPNDIGKKEKQYSGSNPTFLHHEAAALIADYGIQHLLLDLPSVDREEDGGKLLAHHAFWKHPSATRVNSTITELIFVDDKIPDGIYLLNLQIASFVNDASPSKPVLYKMEIL